MVIALRGSATSATTGTGQATSLALNKPTGLVANDFILIYAAVRGTGVPTVTGFTAITPTASASTEFALFYRVADGSEGSTFTVSWTPTNNAAAMCVAYSGVNTSTPFDPSAPANSGTGTTGTFSFVGPTTLLSGTQLVWFAAEKNAVGGVAPGTFGQPSGWTVESGMAQASSNDAANPNIAVMAADLAQVSPGAVGTITGTDSLSTDHCCSVVVCLAAAVTAAVSSAPPPVTPAEIILRQYGLDSVFQSAPPAVPPKAGAFTVRKSTVRGGDTLRGGSPVVASFSAAGTGNLDFEASATMVASAYSIPPPIDVAALILDQYGFGDVFQVIPPQEVSVVAGAGSLAFAATATAQTSLVVPQPTLPAELILRQYGLEQAFQTLPLTQAVLQFPVTGIGNLDFEAASTVGATDYSVQPQIDVAQLILDQYGLSGVFQVVRTQEINPVTGTGTLTFGASGTGVASAYPVPPQVDVAQVILDQYGLSAAFSPPPPVEEINPVAGTGQLTFNAAANIVGTALSSAPVVDAALLILDQYGLGSAFRQPPPVEEANPVAATGSLTFNASATAQTSLVFPVPVTPAELILQQYGLDSVLYAPPLTQLGAQFAVAGAGNLDFEAAATFGATAYATPALADVAQLILDQYGLGSAFAAPPRVQEISRVAGVSNLDFEASSTAGASAYPTPALIGPAQLILQQYGLEQALQVVRGSQALYTAAGGGNLNLDGTATAGFASVIPTPPAVTAALIILRQYGFDAAYIGPGAPPPPVPSVGTLTANDMPLSTVGAATSSAAAGGSLTARDQRTGGPS